MITPNRPRYTPKVVLAERVIRKMAHGVTLYPDEETAEALVGLIVDEDSAAPTFYVLDTIAPDHEAIQRAGYMVEQGDDLQDEIMYWLAINWRRFRDRRRQSYGNALAGKWDAPLRYLGDWHKQPGEMFWPSQGDLATARAIVDDEANAMPQLIAPIVTVAPEWDTEQGPPGDGFDLYATRSDGPNIRVNIWYLNRDLREFIAARPEVLPDDMLPSLPPLGWHLTDRARFEDEYRLLTEDGLAVSVVEWDADDTPPLEICFMTGRVGGNHVIMLVTDQKYPAVAPAVRIAPMLRVGEDDDLFARLWEASEPLDLTALSDFAWSPDRTLLALVRAVEAHIGSSAPDTASAGGTGEPPEEATEAPPAG
ncbi:MAG: hypothetical protein Kow0077_13370 [Anaerolineae bacterium]